MKIRPRYKNCMITIADKLQATNEAHVLENIFRELSQNQEGKILN